MATYTAIIVIIDDAIAKWAGKPVNITIPSGESITYRSLGELIDARKYYAGLVARASVGRGYTITHLKSGGARS